MSVQVMLAALAGVSIVAGLWVMIVGIRGRDPELPAPPRRSRRLLAGPTWWTGWSSRTRALVLAGLAVGVVAWLVSGWLIAVVVFPIAVPGVPALLSSNGEDRRIGQLEAMEEWTRGLAGVLSVGVGLEQAILATLRSTPDAIRPEVSNLASRLRARWSTAAALRAFADDLDDATGDQIAASLLLGSTRRGPGLASVLEGLAQTVADDVRMRRAIEADRAKPRSTARWITLITLAVLGLLALNGDYIAPYRTGLGQLILALLLGGYVLTLLWLRRMTRGAPLPRFIGTTPRGPGGQARPRADRRMAGPGTSGAQGRRPDHHAPGPSRAGAARGSGLAIRLRGASR